jgi:hypothetical protein
MSIHIVYKHNQPAGSSRQRDWCQVQVCGHPMEPNHLLAAADLGMNGLTIRGTVNTARDEPKSVHKEVVLCGDIGAYKDRY